MGRAAVRRQALLLTALLLPTLAACSDDAELASDTSDLDAAIVVWSDPWVAPTTATVAGPALGSDGMLDRVVARRETSYDTGVRATARVELGAARAAGWSPTSSTCTDRVEVALASRDGDAVARLVVSRERPGSVAELQVAARHHLDSSWQAPDAVDATCLDDDAAPTFVAPPLSGEALGGVTDDRDAEWQHSDPAEDFVEAVDDDPSMQDLGVTVAVPRLQDGVNRRQALSLIHI